MNYNLDIVYSQNVLLLASPLLYCQFCITVPGPSISLRSLRSFRSLSILNQLFIEQIASYLLTKDQMTKNNLNDFSFLKQANISLHI